MCSVFLQMLLQGCAENEQVEILARILLKGKAFSTFS